MYQCNCGKSFEKRNSLTTHARFCKEYVKPPIKISKYKIEDIYICECKRTFVNYQSLNAHFSHCLIHRNGKPTNHDKGIIAWSTWCKGLTKETNEGIAKRAKLQSIRLTGKPGHPHTLESRQKLANSAKEHNNGYIRTTWFEVFCPNMNNSVKVQGTWELRFVERLNSFNIPWERGKSHVIQYRKEADEIIHNYHPDFYLPTINSYVEIKGYWWKSKDGRVDDRRKMQYIIGQHPELNIIILDSIEKIQNFKMPA